MTVNVFCVGLGIIFGIIGTAKIVAVLKSIIGGGGGGGISRICLCLTVDHLLFGGASNTSRTEVLENEIYGFNFH